ncbi:hypothetical protein ES704_03790 [subsurface metagenome]|jgi:hypothetical protein
MSRGLGKVERKILKGLKKYEVHCEEKGYKDNWTGTWSLSHYIEGNCEEIFLDNKSLDDKFSHSTYIKTYNAAQSLKRKGYLETKVTTQSKFFNYNVTRVLSVRLKH